MSNDGMNPKRRKLIAATAGLGAVGTGFAAVPFVMSMTPSARARAAGAPVEVDISKLAPGQMLTIEWRGKPVWILNRTPEMLGLIKKTDERVVDPESEVAQQPPYAQNDGRSIKDKYLVVVGICTHLGCVPLTKLQDGAVSGLGDDWTGGFFCPCHGSKFDLAGRVYKNVPAPTNLVVPPHSYLSDSRIIIGVDSEAGAV